MIPSEPGPLLVRFDVDARAERVLMGLRVAAALLAAAAALLLLLGDLPVAVFLVAVLALLVSLGWIAQARKAGLRARQPERYYLALYGAGLALGEGEKTTWVPWSSVRNIDVDEERLELVVERTDAAPLRLEPRYPGVEIHALMHRLRNAWQGACDPQSGV